jgi:hypothetical protein
VRLAPVMRKQRGFPLLLLHHRRIIMSSLNVVYEIGPCELPLRATEEESIGGGNVCSAFALALFPFLSCSDYSVTTASPAHVERYGWRISDGFECVVGWWQRCSVWRIRWWWLWSRQREDEGKTYWTVVVVRVPLLLWLSLWIQRHQ